MGKRFIDEKARCPLYCSEDPQKIYCEGFQDFQWTHLAFQSKTDKKDYKYSRCRGHYEKCPVFRMYTE